MRTVGPESYNSLGSLLRVWTPELRRLCGRRLDSVWLPEGSREPRDCGSVVLGIGSQSLEICFAYADVVSLGLNVVFPSREPGPNCGGRWKRGSSHVFRAAVGKTISEIFFVGQFLDKYPLDAPEDVRRSLIPSAIEFMLDGGYLTLCNGFDQMNGWDKPHKGSQFLKYSVLR